MKQLVLVSLVLLIAARAGNSAEPEVSRMEWTMDGVQREAAEQLKQQAENAALTPLERRSLFVNTSYDITDNVRFTSDLGYTKRQSNRQIAGYPLQSTAVGAPMSADSYFNPTGDTAVNWRRRGWEVPRVTDNSNRSLHIDAALVGFLDDDPRIGVEPGFRAWAEEQLLVDAVLALDREGLQVAKPELGVQPLGLAVVV